MQISARRRSISAEDERLLPPRGNLLRRRWLGGTRSAAGLLSGCCPSVACLSLSLSLSRCRSVAALLPMDRGKEKGRRRPGPAASCESSASPLRRSCCRTPPGLSTCTGQPYSGYQGRTDRAAAWLGQWLVISQHAGEN